MTVLADPDTGLPVPLPRHERASVASAAHGRS